MELKDGSWEALLDYNEGNEQSTIPCIIYPNLEKDFPLGTTFTSKFDFETGTKYISGNIEDGSLTTKINYDTIERTFTVSYTHLDVYKRQLPYHAANIQFFLQNHCNLIEI